MPKIIVREYDNTKAGTSQYSNFSVLIAGDVATGKTVDADTVYEFSSQKDFEKIIGCVPPKPYPYEWQAIACTPGNAFKIVADPEEEETPSENQEANNESEPAENSGEGNEGNDEPVENTRTWSQVKDILGSIYIAGADGQTPGYLVDDAGQQYDNAELESFEDVDPNADYFEISGEALGRNAKAPVKSYGNLMAYTLLGLGYTVLYKKISEEILTDDFWDELTDKSNYDFRYVSHGLLDCNTSDFKDGDNFSPEDSALALDAANAAIIKLAHFVNNFDKTNDEATTGRGDCTALCEIPSAHYLGKLQADAIDSIKSYINGAAKASKYAGYFGPFVVYEVNHKQSPWNKYYPKGTETDIGKFPGVFHYLACAAKAAENYKEWFAIAGYARGVSDFVINHTGCDFGERAQNILQPRCRKATNGLKFAVNLITKIKGNYYLWGNRTAHELGLENTDDGDLKASHFLNIRQLCTTLKKQIYITCRKYTFDPNSDILWVKFCNDIRPTLEDMKGNEGIEDYRFIKVKTDKKAVLKAKVRIVPVYAVEDFDISLTLEDSIAGLVAGVEEE